MKIDFLTIVPESGKYEEIHFGENFFDSLWVEFYISEDNHWLGCFSKSYDNGLNKVIFDEDKNTCCVVAGGKCYLINLETKEIIFETNEHPLSVSLSQSQNPNFFYIGTYHNVMIINEKGLVKEIEPGFMVDGIYLENQLEINY